MGYGGKGRGEREIYIIINIYTEAKQQPNQLKVVNVYQAYVRLIDDVITHVCMCVDS